MRVLAMKDSFVSGRLVPAGFVVTVSDDLKLGKNFKKLSGKEEPVDVIEASAISPTGPNPTAPQQIAPDTTQTVEGYAKPGARVVGEVTKDRSQRIEIVGLDEQQGTEQQVAEEMAADNGGQNDDDHLVEGTVAEITSSIDGETDLDALEAAEKDREQPRSGVLKAIEKEREARKG